MPSCREAKHDDGALNRLLESYLERLPGAIVSSAHLDDGHHHVVEHRELEVAQSMAGHDPARTTALYDPDKVSADEVELVLI